jgi:hypothetical protein
MVKENEKGLKTMNTTKIRVKFDYYSHTDICLVDFIDEGFINLYMFGHEFGPTVVIKADHLEEAYEIFLDYLPEVSEAEIHDAYGISDRKVYDRYCELHREDPYKANQFLQRCKSLLGVSVDGKIPDNGDFVYECNNYQIAPNGGIKYVSDYVWMNVYDKKTKEWLMA